MCISSSLPRSLLLQPWLSHLLLSWAPSPMSSRSAISSSGQRSHWHLTNYDEVCRWVQLRCAGIYFIKYLPAHSWHSHWTLSRRWDRKRYTNLKFCIDVHNENTYTSFTALWRCDLQYKCGRHIWSYQYHRWQWQDSCTGFRYHCGMGWRDQAWVQYELACPICQLYSWSLIGGFVTIFRSCKDVG